jgi:hypothetical protein
MPDAIPRSGSKDERAGQSLGFAKRRLEVLRHSQDANFLWMWRKTRAAGAAQDVPRGASERANPNLGLALFVTPVVFEGFAAGGMAEFAQSLRFDLADALARHAEFLADLFERALMAVFETKA